MGDIAVQRGIAASIGNTGGTSSPGTDFGSLTAAFVLNQCNRRSHSGPESSTGNMEGDDMSGTIELTAVGTIDYTRESGSIATVMRFDWESWEYTGPGGGANEFIVRSRNTVTLTGESTSVTLDNAPTSINDCIPFITGIRTNSTVDDWDSATAVAWLSGANTLNIERGSGANNTVIVQVVTVEFTGSAWQVAHGDSGDDAADTGTITLRDAADGVTAGGGDISDWATAAIHDQFKKNSANGVDDSLADTSAVYEPGSATTLVDWTFNANHVDSVGDDRHFVHVLRHPDMVVTRFSATGSPEDDQNVDVTSASLTDLAESAVWGSTNTSGNGTAYGRGWRSYRLTSLTNVAGWCHRSGNTMAHRVQVIDLTAITSAVPQSLVWETASSPTAAADWTLTATISPQSLVWESAGGTAATFADDFDRADAGDLNGGAGQGPGDGDWTQGGTQNPPHTIISNEASASATTGHTLYSQVDAAVAAFADDQVARAIVQVKNATQANWCGVVVRYGDEADIDTPVGYMARLDGNGDFGIFEFDGTGSATQLALNTFGASIDTDYEIVIRAVGTTIDVWILQTSTLGTIDVDSDTPTVTTTDGTLTSGTIGIASRNSAQSTGPHPQFVTFEGGDEAASTGIVDTAADWSISLAAAAQSLVWEPATETNTPTDWAANVAGAASLVWESATASDVAADWALVAAGAVSLVWETAGPAVPTPADWTVNPAGAVSLVWEPTTETNTPTDWTVVSAGAATLEWEAATETTVGTDWAVTVLSEFVVALGALTDPSDDTGHVLKVRARKANPADAGTLDIELRQANTVIHSYQIVPTDTFVTYEEAIPTGSAATITDYTDLNVRVVASTATTFEPQISWIELQIPAAATTALVWEPASSPSNGTDWTVNPAGAVALVWESATEASTPTDWTVVSAGASTLIFEAASASPIAAEWTVLAGGAVALVWESASAVGSQTDWAVTAAGAGTLIWEPASTAVTLTDWTLTAAGATVLVWEPDAAVGTSLDWSALPAGAGVLVWDATSTATTPNEWAATSGPVTLVWESAVDTSAAAEWALSASGALVLVWEPATTADAATDWTAVSAGAVTLEWETAAASATPADWTLPAAGVVALVWESAGEVDTPSDWALTPGVVALTWEPAAESSASTDWAVDAIGAGTLVWEDTTATGLADNWSVTPSGVLSLNWEPATTSAAAADWALAAVGQAALVWEPTVEASNPTEWAITPAGTVTLTWESASETGVPIDWTLTPAGVATLVWEPSTEATSASDWSVTPSGVLSLDWEPVTETTSGTDWGLIVAGSASLVWEPAATAAAAADWTHSAGGSLSLVWEPAPTTTTTSADWAAFPGPTALPWEPATTTVSPTDWDITTGGATTVTWEPATTSTSTADWTMSIDAGFFWTPDPVDWTPDPVDCVPAAVSWDKVEGPDQTPW